MADSASPDWIRGEIERLKLDKEQLENRISALQSQLHTTTTSTTSSSITPFCANNGSSPNAALSAQMIYRYSRQLLLPDFGVQGQCKLSQSRVLVIGAGGLGSPVAMYLASCGVGCIGIVDGDTVELNNLHRQIIHTEAYIGKPKVQSAAAACRAINSSVKPLVSGAALGLEGQLTVYNHKGSPCYRCLFPTPPPSAACQRCSDSGVLGVVPGVIGCMQALEAIKIAADVGEPLSGRMLLFDALSARIRIVKLRGRSSACTICGENSSFTKEEFERFDYENFTQSPMSDRTRPKLSLLPESARITIKEYKEVLDKSERHTLLDVRPVHQFKITSLPNSVNIPLSDLEKELPKLGSMLSDSSLYVICRRGNTSQTAVQLLHQKGFFSAKDIIGGLESWAQEIDPKFPIY
ncbi:adenylyltransferase and sulfurtransferase MOCS3-2-like isoform X2 [Carex rostrata]